MSGKISHGFFRNSYSTIGVASKIKKNHVTIMVAWAMRACKLRLYY